jgi:hypothetical protein
MKLELTVEEFEQLGLSRSNGEAFVYLKERLEETEDERELHLARIKELETDLMHALSNVSFWKNEAENLEGTKEKLEYKVNSLEGELGVLRYEDGKCFAGELAKNFLSLKAACEKLHDGEKIAAVKILKTDFGLGLMMAKQLADLIHGVWNDNLRKDCNLIYNPNLLTDKLRLELKDTQASLRAADRDVDYWREAERVARNGLQKEGVVEELEIAD